MRDEKLQEILSPAVESAGYILWGIEYSSRKGRDLLRVYIDNANGISVSDCEKASRQISAVLDVEDVLPVAYDLEVSSPGMDRKFFKKSQYVDYLNHSIKVRFKTEEDLFVTRKGILKEANEDGLVLESNNVTFYIEFDSIEKANLEIEEE